jgi:ribosomal protein L39E
MRHIRKAVGGVAPAQAARLAAVGIIAFAAGAYGTSRPAPSPTRAIDREPLTLLYVGAEDCAPCRAWRRDERDAFLASLDRSRIIYREVIATKTAATFEEASWPEDLRERLADARKVGGVPQWIIVRNERIVMSAGGLSQWRERVLPMVQGLENGG